HTHSSLAPVAVVLGGLLLRLHRVSYQSLWYDESLSVSLSELPVADIVSKLLADPSTNTYPPLHFLTLHVWFNFFGVGATQARLLSVLFGTGAVLVAYLLAKRLFNRECALFSATLVAVSQLGI